MRLTNGLRLNIHLIGPFFAVLAVISFNLLFNNNVDMGNEIDVLPLAKQFADPTWIPKDWYLNQAPGYRLLFATLFGHMIVTWGFLATSILGRLLCYSLVAYGLVLIGQRLGLMLPLLLAAVSLFLTVNPEQGIAAREWLVGGLEAKAVAYGLVLLSIAYLLRYQYAIVALLLGLATSFHVLVGGWTTLIVVGQVILQRQISTREPGRLFRLGLVYLFFSGFAILPVIQQLFSESPAAAISPSFIYVFIRLPHHLYPPAWEPTVWVRLVVCLSGLVISMRLLKWKQKDWSEPHYQAQVDLFQLTLLSLIPFAIGLLISPFDQQGSWLQFYPFRVGDVLLPLNTLLLLACVVQSMVPQQRIIRIACISWIAIACVLHIPNFQNQLVELRQLPNQEPAFIALCDWIKARTPADAIIISPPVEFAEFSWLTERATIAKYKLLPQTKADIVEWYERLADLGGGSFPLPTASESSAYSRIREQLTENYYRLGNNQVNQLIQKYAASYFITHVDHPLTLPIAYRNDRYILYAASASTKN